MVAFLIRYFSRNVFLAQSQVLTHKFGNQFPKNQDFSCTIDKYNFIKLTFV